MANVKISALPAATTIASGDLLPIVQGGVTKQATADGLPYAAKGRRAVAVYDEFSRYPDGTLTGTPLVGNAWQVTGGQPPTITAGRLSSSGTGYAWQALAAPVTGVSCDIVFGTTGTIDTTGVMTLAITSGTNIDLNNLAAHCGFSLQGFNLTVRKDGGSFDTILFGGWTRPPLPDGTTVYTVGIRRRGNTIIVDGPNGEQYAVTDPRVGQLAGNVAFWEPTAAGAVTGRLISVSATSTATTGRPGPSETDGELAPGGFFLGPGGQIVGGRNTANEVSLGIDTASNLPALMFGPTGVVLTTLQKAAAAGATTITTDGPIPSGSTVQLESGNGSETVTTSSGSTGSAPSYTTPVPALAKAHAVGAAVAVTPPSGQVAKVLNNGGTIIFPGTVRHDGSLYLNGYTAEINQPSSGVVASNGLGAGKGAFRAGRTTTAGRPTPADAGEGAQMYDTTLHKPIWSDGSTWRDAAGTAV